MRSRQGRRHGQPSQRGIISACAEQTRQGWRRVLWRKDHLRVCGADDPNAEYLGADNGSSPRVRSRPPSSSPDRRRIGIISACAEQTGTVDGPCRHPPDHLRVCGADCSSTLSAVCIAGSSPRVRSRPAAPSGAGSTRRIISACAEQTFQTVVFRRDRRDHLRVCGADPISTSR